MGEEYEGVEVATAVVRARRAGEAIVHEAKRRGVEAIVLAAEEPTRVRGGVLLGGKPGLRDTYVGETTRYVRQQGAVPRDPDRAAAGDGQPTRCGPSADEAPLPRRPSRGVAGDVPTVDR